MPLNHSAHKGKKQNLRDLAWTTVYFALLGCTSPVLEALYYNAAEFNRTKERVRQTLHQHLGMSHFESLEHGPRRVYFITTPEYEFEFSVSGGTVWPLEYAVAAYGRQIYYRCRREGPFTGRAYSKEDWFAFLESDLDIN